MTCVSLYRSIMGNEAVDTRCFRESKSDDQCYREEGNKMSTPQEKT